VFVPSKPFQPVQLSAGKAGAYPSEALERLLALPRLAEDKHSSLFRKFVNYGRKKVL
jgi:hypothetical protein